MIVVTHLLGTGHLSRAATLARAFSGAGHRVTLVSGGMPAPQLDLSGVDLVPLPPLRSDGTDFTRLLTEAGEPADARYLDDRRATLLTALDKIAPQILVTELFPFGRRSLGAEFTALLEAARAMTRSPVILSSVRDILAPPSKPAKAAQAADLIARFYDAVLVHSDPAITRLEQSWPVTPDAAGKLVYTGYVAPPAAAPDPAGPGAGEILVSAGGGPVGAPLFRAAIGAARRMPETPWRLLVGGAGAGPLVDTLSAEANGLPVTVETARPEFRQMLHVAAASVSMCGYNTAMDLLQSGVPAVLVPFDAGNEVEQGLRAESLARRPNIAVLRSDAAQPAALTDALRRVIAAGRQPACDLNFAGAAETVRIATNLAEGVR
ncbi:glycosyl transferase [Cribrihabitans marinus]|nr:glycosyl transferase [Cribrihabitans marinus]